MAIRWPRKIVHIDMDAFFAAVEQRDDPSLRGKPVIVGGDPYGRGVVSTASYEARKFGIRSAMPAAEARRRCPEAIFLRTDFAKYEAVSRQVMAVLRQHTDLVEPVSIDEAYLDVSRHRLSIDDPVMIAKLIKQTIHAVTRLTASAGVAPNKFLAKIASDLKKPDGLTVVEPAKVRQFLEPLGVRKIPGVGPVTEAHLENIGIRTCGDLAGQSATVLCREFGKFGMTLHERSRGIDTDAVVPYTPPKQLSTEETYPKDVRNLAWLCRRLEVYANEVFEQVRESGFVGRTVVLKVKYHDFELITRSRTLKTPPKDPRMVYEVCRDLLESKTKAGQKPVRLLGVGISGLTEAESASSGIARDLFSGV